MTWTPIIHTDIGFQVTLSPAAVAHLRLRPYETQVKVELLPDGRLCLAAGHGVLMTVINESIELMNVHDPMWDMNLPPRVDLAEVYKEEDAATAAIKP